MGKEISVNSHNSLPVRQEQLEIDDHYSLINLPTPVIPVLQRSDYVPQVVACLAASSILILTGVNLTFSAVLLPELMSSESSINVTQDEASWIASIVTIATTVGSLVSGPLMDRFGRKLICSVTCVPIIISWIIIGATTSVHGIYCGRLLSGFGAGLSTAPLVYISEVVNQRCRPTMLCLISTFVSFGILLTCVLYLWLNYVQMSVCFAVLSFFSFLMTWPIPDSPHWLLMKRSEKKARDALRWFYRRDSCYHHELKRLLDSHQSTPTSTSSQGSLVKYFSEYTKLSTLRPIGILMMIFIFQQISGAYIVIFYAVNILQLVGGKYGNIISEYTAFVILGVIRFAMSIVTSVASSRCGRRPLSIISGLGMAASALIAAIFISSSRNFGNLFQIDALTTEMPPSVRFSTSSYFNNTPLYSSYKNVTSSLGPDNLSMNSSFMDGQVMLNELLITNVDLINKTDDVTNFSMVTNGITAFSSDVTSEDDGQWVPIVCVLVYVFFSSMGILVIPWTLIGELPPLSVRGSCGGFMMAFSYILMFAVVKAFPYLLEITKIRGMFYVFSAASFLGSLHVFFFLPETRGKSFKEIEAHFK